MANISTPGPGGKETKSGNAGDTSGGKTSRKAERIPIDPAARLRILQQSIYDCQECGYDVKVLAVSGGIAVVILGTRLDENGNIIKSVPELPRTKEG